MSQKSSDNPKRIRFNGKSTKPDVPMSLSRVKMSNWPEVLKRVRKASRKSEMISGEDMKVVINY